MISPNETAAALTSTGDVYLNIRHRLSHRAKAYSSTCFSDWTQYGPDYRLWDPQCFGSVAAYHDGINPYSIIFVNCNSKTSRKNVTVRISVDDGKAFPYSRVLDADRGGYTEVATDGPNGLIYLLYEDQYGITDHLAVCNYAWIMEQDQP